MTSRVLLKRRQGQAVHSRRNREESGLAPAGNHQDHGLDVGSGQRPRNQQVTPHVPEADGVV